MAEGKRMENKIVFNADKVKISGPKVDKRERDKKDWEQLVSMGIHARTVRETSQWVLGDLALEVTIVYGKDSLGKYAREINVDRETLARYRQVSRAWPKKIRKKFQDPDGDYFMSHRHFQVLAPRSDKEEWLNKSMDNSYSVAQLQVELKKSEGKFKEDLAVASITLSRGEFEEIIRWYNEIFSINNTQLTEFSDEVLLKVKKGLKKSTDGK
jgi:hypothetical protein